MANPSPRASLMFHPVLHWVVLGVSLLVTVLAWQISASSLQSRFEERFSLQTDDIAQSIQRRMLGYQTALRAGAGFFKSHDNISASQWQTLITSLRIQETFPGIQGVGFTRMSPAGLRLVQSESALPKEVASQGLSAVAFLEPQDARNLQALGFDQFADPVRRAAMWQAMVSGEPALSGRVRLSIENGVAEQHGFLMFIPVYRSNLPTASEDEHRKAILGFVFGVFRSGDLMAGILGQSAAGLHFELYDDVQATPATFLYQSDSPALTEIPHTEKPLLTREKQLSMSGRSWLIRFHADAKYIDREASLPTAVAVAGLLINALLFSILRILARSRRELEQGLGERNTAYHKLQLAQVDIDRSETTLRNLMDSLSSSVALVDGQGNIRQVNRAWRDFGAENGADSELCVGRNYNYFAVLEHALAAAEPGAREIMENMERLIEGEIESFQIEYPCHAPDKQRWLQLSVTRMRDARDQYVISHTDITTVYLARAEISRHADMLNSSNTPILLVAANGEVLGSNHQGRTLIGGGDAQDIMTLVEKHLPEVVSGKSISLDVLRFVANVGVRYLQLSLSPHVEEGQVTAAVVVVHDVTELHQARDQLVVHQEHLEHLIDARTAELTAAEHRLQVILETTADGIISCDAEGNINYANPAAEELLGYAPGELHGLPMHATIHHHHSDGSRHPIEECPVHAALNGAIDPNGVEDCFWRKDDQVLPVRYSSRKIFNAEQIDGCVVGFVDISDRKAADAARELALDVAERTARFKSEFLANMSHEIRTPLNAVIASAMLMERDETLPRQKERLHRIVNSSQHLLRLINDILDFSKLEAGHLKLEQVDFKLANIFEGVTSQMHEAVSQKGLTWHTDIDPRIPPSLKGDALRLGQVLLNFASNAVKFTDHGSIELAARWLGNKGNTVGFRIEVRDTGCGFDPAKAEQLFESFVQADASTTRQFGGTGLGLAISKQIIELMAGRIGAISTPGEGSTFWVELSLEHGQSDPETHRKSRSLKGKRAILLTHDSITTEKLAAEFSQLGITLQVASSAAELALRVETSARIGRHYEFVFCADDLHDIAGLCDHDIQTRLRSQGLGKRPHLIRYYDTNKLRDHDESCQHCFDADLSVDCDSVSLKEALDDISSREQSIDASAQSTAAAKTDLSALKDYRILLVEDNPINQQVAMDMLGSAGLTADIANNGREAFVLAENRQYDLILMDMQMPIMGGVEASIEIRRLPEYSNTPIIAMTANAFDVHRQECLNAGMNDFLSKPVEPERLYETLKRWLPARTTTATVVAPISMRKPELRVVEGHVKDAAILPDIAGVNVHAGVQRLSGRPHAYLRLLEQLIELHGKDHDLILARLQAGQVEDARRAAHSLKGSSAMLCAEAVSAAALAIEQDIDAGLDIAAMAPRFTALADALNDIRAGLAATQ